MSTIEDLPDAQVISGTTLNFTTAESAIEHLQFSAAIISGDAAKAAIAENLSEAMPHLQELMVCYGVIESLSATLGGISGANLDLESSAAEMNTAMAGWETMLAQLHFATSNLTSIAHNTVPKTMADLQLEVDALTAAIATPLQASMLALTEAGATPTE